MVDLLAIVGPYMGDNAFLTGGVERTVCFAYSSSWVTFLVWMLWVLLVHTKIPQLSSLGHEALLYAAIITAYATVSPPTNTADHDCGYGDGCKLTQDLILMAYMMALGIMFAFGIRLCLTMRNALRIASSCNQQQPHRTADQGVTRDGDSDGYWSLRTSGPRQDGGYLRPQSRISQRTQSNSLSKPVHNVRWMEHGADSKTRESTSYRKQSFPLAIAPRFSSTTDRPWVRKLELALAVDASSPVVSSSTPLPLPRRSRDPVASRRSDRRNRRVQPAKPDSFAQLGDPTRRRTVIAPRQPRLPSFPIESSCSHAYKRWRKQTTLGGGDNRQIAAVPTNVEDSSDGAMDIDHVDIQQAPSSLTRYREPCWSEFNEDDDENAADGDGNETVISLPDTAAAHVPSHGSHDDSLDQMSNMFAQLAICEESPLVPMAMLPDSWNQCQDIDMVDIDDEANMAIMDMDMADMVMTDAPMDGMEACVAKTHVAGVTQQPAMVQHLQAQDLSMNDDMMADSSMADAPVLYSVINAPPSRRAASRPRPPPPPPPQQPQPPAPAADVKAAEAPAAPRKIAPLRRRKGLGTSQEPGDAMES